MLGAGNETRTRDPNLGKVVLYQLSYSRYGKGGIVETDGRLSSDVDDAVDAGIHPSPDVITGHAARR